MIRLGVIGYGGRIHGIIDHVLRQLDPSVRVVGVVDPNEAGARQRPLPDPTSAENGGVALNINHGSAVTRLRLKPTSEP